MNETANLTNILITSPLFLILALTIATIVATRWKDVAYYKISSGFISGAFAGIAMTTFLLFIAAPLISHPLSNSIKILSTLIQGQNTANLSQINLLPVVLTSIFLTVASSLFGALYTAILATKQMNRIIFGGILFGLAVWAILQYIIFPYLFPSLLKNFMPPLWLATAFAIYGLVLGELIAYSKHWKNILDP